MASELDLPWTCIVGGNTVVNVPNPYTNPYSNASNTAPTWAVWWLKERLKEAGWTVVQSCAITVAPSTYSVATDGTDLWNDVGGTFNPARFGSVTSTGNRSWIALKAPTPSDYYFIIDLVSPANRGAITFYFAKESISTGTTSARPSNVATEFGKLLPFFDTGTTATHYQSLHVVPSGLAKGAFMLTTSSGGNNFDSVLSFVPLKSYHAADTRTWVTFMLGIGSAAGTGTTSPFNMESKTVLGKYAGGDTTAGGTVYACCYPTLINGTTILYTFFTAPFNNRSNFDATFAEFPILVGSADVSDLKGTLTDITLAPSLAANGSVYPPPTSFPFTYKKTKNLNFWLPWTANVAPIM